jgi:site-specific recombinase XerD
MKGKHEGVLLTLPPGARRALVSLIAWKREEKERLAKRAPLFISRKGFRLSRRRAREIFKAAYEKVELEGHVTTHSLRKSLAKMVCQNSGNDLLVTQ